MPTTNLFRGQVIGLDLERIGTILKVVLDCEDYNRLWSRAAVGAPAGDTFIVQDDDTRVPIDPFATNEGTGDDDVFRYLVATYWPGPALGTTTYVKHFRDQQDTVSWQTALSDLGAILDEWAAQTSGALRYWADADLEAHWQAVAQTEWSAVGWSADQLYFYGYPTRSPDEIIPAPYGLNNDDPDWSTEVMPISLRVRWDWAAMAANAYVRGGTPAPEGSGYVGGPGSTGLGTAYIDAPGSILAADREAIGAWHFAQEFREFANGSATVPSGYDGWRVGQSVPISDDVLSQYTDHPLDQTYLMIQRVTGRLVSTGPGLHISLDGGADMIEFVSEWTSFTFEETLGSAGKATVVMELTGIDAGFARPNDVRIWTDGDAAIEYDIEFGDIAAGPLAREQKRDAKQPSNRFIVTVQDDQIPVGFDTLVTAQLATAAGVPLAIANVYLEWVLLQWANEGTSEVAFWQAAVDKMNGYIAVYQAIIDGGGTLTPHQQWAMDTDIVTRDHDQDMLDAAILAAAGGPLTAGDGYSLADVSGITDATGRAFTRLSHDTAGTTVLLTVEAVALPIS